MEVSILLRDNFARVWWSKGVCYSRGVSRARMTNPPVACYSA